MQLLAKNITITVFFYVECKFVGSNDHFLRENFLLRVYFIYNTIYAIQVKGKFAEKLDDFDTLFDTLFYIRTTKASHLN